MNKKDIRKLGMLIGLSAMAMALICFDWKLTVILFLALFGNNLEQFNKE